MSKTDLFSIIIPNYNRESLISETLDSVLNQTFKNWECIVVDDGSSDNSETVIKNFCSKDNRFRFYQRTEKYNSGGNGARNMGLDLTNGEYVIWLDSDDLIHKTFLAEHHKTLSFSKLNFSVCKCNSFSTNPFEVQNFDVNQIESSTPLLDYIGNHIKIMTSSSVFKKKFLIDNKFFFNEKLRAAQEWEFYVRIFADFSRYEVINKSLVSVRTHEGGMSHNPEIMFARSYHYIIARKLMKFYLKKKNLYTAEIDSHFQSFGKKYVPILITSKNYKLLNSAIFTGGLNASNIISFFSIYFLIFTGRNKNRTKFI